MLTTGVLAIWRLMYFYETFVLKQTLGIILNPESFRDAKNPPQLLPYKRYRQARKR